MRASRTIPRLLEKTQGGTSLHKGPSFGIGFLLLFGCLTLSFVSFAFPSNAEASSAEVVAVSLPPIEVPVGDFVLLGTSTSTPTEAFVVTLKSPVILEVQTSTATPFPSELNMEALPICVEQGKSKFPTYNFTIEDGVVYMFRAHGLNVWHANSDACMGLVALWANGFIQWETASFEEARISCATVAMVRGKDMTLDLEGTDMVPVYVKNGSHLEPVEGYIGWYLVYDPTGEAFCAPSK